MIAAPRWYAENLGAPFAAAEEVVDQRAPRALRPLVARSRLARGIALGLLARGGTGVVLIRRARGSLPALLVAALPPARRRMFVVELLRRPASRRAWKRATHRAWTAMVERPALRRAVAGAQVMTEWERDDHVAHYRLEPGRVHHVPWALRGHGEPDPVPVRPQARRVLCSGRAATDWETLFAAAGGSGWELVAVCSRRDERRVRALAGEAEVHVELPRAEHHRLLRTADVYVLALTAEELSAGQVRLMAAVDAGVPVVATAVRSLDGYAVAGETAVMVPPGDAGRLRGAVDALLADPGHRLRLREAALARAAAWTYDDYFAALGALIVSSLAAPASPEAE
jgi:hypothetical protein